MSYIHPLFSMKQSAAGFSNLGHIEDIWSKSKEDFKTWEEATSALGHTKVGS